MILSVLSAIMEIKERFGVHDENKLIKEIVRDALKLEDMLKVYMTGSTLSKIQEDMGQMVGQYSVEWDILGEDNYDEIGQDYPV